MAQHSIGGADAVPDDAIMDSSAQEYCAGCLEHRSQVLARHPLLPVLRPGRISHTESGRVIYAVITIERVYARAIETADAFELALELGSGDIGIYPGIDYLAAGLSAGRIGLWEGIRQVVLRDILYNHPSAELIVIAEDDMRINVEITRKGKWKTLLHSVLRHPRPICMLGFCVSAQCQSFGQRRPTNGSHLWTIRSSFVTDFTRLMGEVSPMHFDLALIEKFNHFICHTTFPVAGYTSHVTDCADPGDPDVDQLGVRAQFVPRLSYHVLRELDVVNLWP